MMIETMKNNSMYAFMLAVHTITGTEAYKTVKTAATTHVDCENSQNWIKLTKQILKGDKA